MEADWEVDIGPEAGFIDAVWSGFVDLQRQPERITDIPEATQFPPLAETLLRLNGQTANPSEPTEVVPVWTAKCDLWDISDLDPDEMEATPSETSVGLACYIDILPDQGKVFPNLAAAEHWARDVSARLQKIPARCCRADLVIRQAAAGNYDGLGITAYLSACGPNSNVAKASLAKALQNLVTSVLPSTETAS